MYVQSLGWTYRVKVSPGPYFSRGSVGKAPLPPLIMGLPGFVGTIVLAFASPVCLDLFLIHIAYKDSCYYLEGPPAWVRIITRSLVTSIKGIFPNKVQARVLGIGTQPCLLDSALQSLRYVSPFMNLVYAFKGDEDRSWMSYKCWGWA